MKRFKRSKNNIIYFAVRGAIRVAGILPLPLVEQLLGAVGVCAYYLAGKERQVALRNLATAFGGETSLAERKRLARSCFRNLGVNAAALMRAYARDDADELLRMVEIRGLEHMEEAHRQGRGVIAISAHIGAFDFISLTLACIGLPISTVGARLYDDRLDRFIVETRTRHGSEYISKDDSPRKILRTLRNNRIVGILIDQDTKVARCFVPFFGKLCATPIGAAKMAKSSGAPVLFVHIFRDSNRKHIISISPQVEWIELADKEEELVANTAHWTALIEEAVREHPEQWVWMHKRWKRQPPAQNLQGE